MESDDDVKMLVDMLRESAHENGVSDGQLHALVDALVKADRAIVAATLTTVVSLGDPGGSGPNK